MVYSFRGIKAQNRCSATALLKWLARQVPGMIPKAYRWIAEMREIAAFLGEDAAARTLFEGAAGFYERIAADAAGPNRETAVLKSFAGPAAAAVGEVAEPGAASEALANRTCTPCRGGIPPMDAEAARQRLAQVPQWELSEDGTTIRRSYRFANFREALDFVRRAGELAEIQGHHPDIAFGWGHAAVSLRTKKIKGLHDNDFIMAAKFDRLAAG